MTDTVDDLFVGECTCTIFTRKLQFIVAEGVVPLKARIWTQKWIVPACYTVVYSTMAPPTPVTANKAVSVY